MTSYPSLSMAFAVAKRAACFTASEMASGMSPLMIVAAASWGALRSSSTWNWRIVEGMELAVSLAAVA
eukprot:scaffold163782_cov32-Tisochrysis_lutea.AAC.2